MLKTLMLLVGYIFHSITQSFKSDHGQFHWLPNSEKNHLYLPTRYHHLEVVEQGVVAISGCH